MQGLPQYAEAFRRHAITPLDFPVLVERNGEVLDSELGVRARVCVGGGWALGIVLKRKR